MFYFIALLLAGVMAILVPWHLALLVAMLSGGLWFGGQALAEDLPENRNVLKFASGVGQIICVLACMAFFGNIVLWAVGSGSNSCSYETSFGGAYRVC